MAQLLPNVVQKFFDSNGAALAGGKLYSYAAGTTTPQSTYTDGGGLTANANPTILDAGGMANIWLGSLAYKFVLKDSLGNTLWTVDNVSIIQDDAITTAKILNLAITTAKINDKAVTNAKMADMLQSTFKGRAAASGTGAPVDLTATQATAILNVMTGDSGSGGVKGLVGAPAAGDAAAHKYWAADGTFSQPPGTGKYVQTLDITTNTSTTVPAGVTSMDVLGVGAGGGGGGGSSPTANGGGGGGGGAGATPLLMKITVVPGDLLTIGIGAAGAGAAATGHNVKGLSGSAGGNTTITGTGVDLIFPGANGGEGGDTDGTKGAGGSGYATTLAWYPTASAGGDGATASNTNGSPGTPAVCAFVGALGGAAIANNANNGRAGGGGGGGIGKGGVGGQGTVSSTPGNAGAAPVATHYGAGGGGGAGSGVTAANASIVGGAGIQGFVRLQWGAN